MRRGSCRRPGWSIRVSIWKVYSSPRKPASATFNNSSASVGRGVPLRENKVAQIDHLAEKMLRGFASRASRRSLFSVLGGFLAGAAALPLLPVARSAEGQSDTSPSDPNSGQTAPQSSGNPQDPGDPTKCDYWRYCAIDGSLCACYGGSGRSCPPGTEMSPHTWMGSFRNTG